jgi:hypothetical protein
MRGGANNLGNHRRQLHACYRRQARDFYTRHAVWIVRNMRIKRAEIEWRVRLLTGPDDRTLTGRVLGDPRYARSALYAKRMGLI